MVTKKSGTKKSKVKVGKLQLNKETVKDLTASEIRKIKGGVAAAGSGKACHTGKCLLE